MVGIIYISDIINVHRPTFFRERGGGDEWRGLDGQTYTRYTNDIYLLKITL